MPRGVSATVTGVRYLNLTGLILLTVVVVGSGSHVESGSPTFCAALVDQISSCWIDNPDIPRCKGSDDVELCAENELISASTCDDQTKKEMELIKKVYSFLTSVVCENIVLRDHFVEKRACWIMARNCALPVGILSTKNVTRSLCRETIAGMIVCGNHNFMCQELQRNYTRAVLRSSACSIFPNVIDDFANHLPRNQGGSTVRPLFALALLLGSFLCVMGP